MVSAITLRKLVQTAGASSGIGLLAACAVAAAQQSAALPIEPSTVKRRGSGLRGYDPERAFDGFTLLSRSRRPTRRSI
jgi:hypothetical protein